MVRTSHIGLLRHGEVSGGECFRGSSDDPLTGKGWLQLWSAVGNIDMSWDYIVTSPLQRCAEFAFQLGEKYSVPVASDRRLQEIHFGVWEGHSASDILSQAPQSITKYWNDPVHNTPPMAEPLLQFRRRVLSAWQDVLSRYRHKNVLVITHGGVIRVLLCHIQEHPIERLLELDVGHASLVQFVVEKERAGQGKRIVQIHKS